MLIFFSAAPAFAKVVGIFDVDGSVNNDEGPDAAWVTPYILQRVDEIDSMWQQTPMRTVTIDLTTPEQIGYYNLKYKTSYPVDSRRVRVSVNLPHQITMSFADFNEYEGQFSRAGEGHGGLTPILLTFDPLFPNRELLIVPGYYAKFTDTYKYYREGTGLRKKNYLLENLKSSQERQALLASRGAVTTWKGLAFPLLKEFMSSPDTVPNVTISSLRGQRARDYFATDDYLVEIGEFNFSKSKDGRRPQVFFHNQPESRRWGRSGTEKKVKIPKRTLDALRRSAGAKHWERQADGTFRKMHTLIVSENDPTHLYNISQLFMDESGDRLAGRVKLVIFNATNSFFVDRIKNALFPDRWTVIEPGRRPRPATEQEIYDWHHQKETQEAGERWAATHSVVAMGACDDELVTGGGVQ